MKDSICIATARQILQNAAGKPLSRDSRKEKSIELAGLMLEEARRIQTYKEKRQQKTLARMLNERVGQTFVTNMMDQCFRTNNTIRIADQLVYLIQKFGIPKFLSPFKKFQIFLFKYLGKPFSGIAVPLLKRMLRQEMGNVILPGEPELLSSHLKRRRHEGVHTNLNHLGEAILGEGEAKKRLNMYLDDLANPDVEYVSIKISTLYSQISHLGREGTLSILEQRLSLLYRAAQKHFYSLSNGSKVPKFVNLDMEEYQDLHLTVDLFMRILDNPEFLQFSAGIVLQAYLPDAFNDQKKLTAWAIDRISRGGAPIKIRLVKGANLAMEQVESSLKGWPQAPYLSKSQTDANYIQMVDFALTQEKSQAVHIGIATHNLFDIAYAMLLRAEQKIERNVGFEMLEGMANHIKRVVQCLTGDMLLYCPAATRDEFQNAIAYLIRRLDENTAPENFLRHSFDLLPYSKEWQHQANRFSQSCDDALNITNLPRRLQSRLEIPQRPARNMPFHNEPDTDWSLLQNVKWAESIRQKWQGQHFGRVPITVGGKNLASGLKIESKSDPSRPNQELYTYVKGSIAEAGIALDTAVQAFKEWSKKPLSQRTAFLSEAAYQLMLKRADLIGAMAADTGKTFEEADVEVSEAIDFANYYRQNIEELYHMTEVGWTPKGPVLVAPPWNFPCSIPAGGILAALAAGNSVIFKPAPEAIFIGWKLVNILWDAGISKETLQFFCCDDDPVGSFLIKDERIALVILTGATDTAKKFMQLRPCKDLIAETGGKNSIIITSMADRDLAIKDILKSAFGHSGQKCSACSLGILEKEVYDDPNFKRQLYDAAISLKPGTPWNFSTKINPLIRNPGRELQRALTSLDEGEEWLLKPVQDKENENLWSPGIKLGVKPGSFTHQTELFGPVLALMRAEDLCQAVAWANATPYGLTAGIYTLDEREQKFWLEHIVAGNCYINRTITGAIVRRQPFGGCKESSFGYPAKAGGPNFLINLMLPKMIQLPGEKAPLNEAVLKLDQIALRSNMTSMDVELWSASAGSYAFYWDHYFSKFFDPDKIRGQSNDLYYVPRKRLTLRVQDEDTFLDVLRVIAAAATCGAGLEVSIEKGRPEIMQMEKISEVAGVGVIQESEAELACRIVEKLVDSIRFLSPVNTSLQQVIGNAACRSVTAAVMASGRIELLHYLNEISLSANYHRYGYIGHERK